MWSFGACLYEVLTGERLVTDIKNDSECLRPKQYWYRAMTQYKGAVEVCKRLLIWDPSARISANDFLARIVTALPNKK